MVSFLRVCTGLGSGNVVISFLAKDNFFHMCYCWWGQQTVHIFLYDGIGICVVLGRILCRAGNVIGCLDFSTGR